MRLLCALLILVAAGCSAISAKETGTFLVIGTVTEVQLALEDYPFIVVSPDDPPTSNNIIVSCPDHVCDGVEEDDLVIINGYMGEPGEACSGREPYYNPLIASDVVVCTSGGVCAPL